MLNDWAFLCHCCLYAIGSVNVCASVLNPCVFLVNPSAVAHGTSSCFSSEPLTSLSLRIESDPSTIERRTQLNVNFCVFFCSSRRLWCLR